ncbi:unnamed protein product [Lactuca virosa]|uniref:TIR domain-containing protein n=1 Tax=Lactuca virosa TaxID=75947 RepID=A0AAU9MTC2_9ASTR|nr:unnamed protein product [Lactuca virosa]
MKRWMRNTIKIYCFLLTLKVQVQNLSMSDDSGSKSIEWSFNILTKGRTQYAAQGSTGYPSNFPVKFSISTPSPPFLRFFSVLCNSCTPSLTTINIKVPQENIVIKDDVAIETFEVEAYSCIHRLCHGSCSDTELYSSFHCAFSSQSWNHDVFLSFRGEDTRRTFVDHLYSALVLQGIDTYKDDETLCQGESIRPSLVKAIEESQIVVIVFSENYVDSPGCLDELAHIMKCKDMRGQIVMPIFYDVDSSEVRKQKRKYGEAFAKHELENKVESWRKAIVDASNLSGWEPMNIANGHESKAIKEIVDKISSRLQLITSNANENLIGTGARVHGLESNLQLGSGAHDRNMGGWGWWHGLETLQEKILSKNGSKQHWSSKMFDK